MKTKEFIEKVKELGFDVEVKSIDDFIKIEHKIVIRNKENKCVVSALWTERVYEFDNRWEYFTKLAEETKKELFDLLVKYSSTPIEGREEEKKYYLKHKFLTNGIRDCYLNYKINYDNWILSDSKKQENYKTQFTEQEIEAIKEKINTSLDDFEIIEVE